MAVNPRVPDNPHADLTDATQLVPRTSGDDATQLVPRTSGDDATQLVPRASADDATQLVPRAPRDELSATLIMPRRERPGSTMDMPGANRPPWQGVEPLGAARKSRRLRNRRNASMAFAATGLIVVVSGAWALLSSDPGDPTFAGAAPAPPAASASADPAGADPAAGLAPLQPTGDDVTSAPGETAGAGATSDPVVAEPSGDPATSEPRPSAHPSTEPGPARATMKATTATRAPKADSKPKKLAASVSIASPRNGANVEESVTVSGEAEVPDGHHVYLLAGTAQSASSCEGRRHFVCGPVTLDGDEESVQLTVVVAAEDDGGAEAARAEVTVQRPAE
jgi:hypothetical protein